MATTIRNENLSTLYGQDGNNGDAIAVDRYGRLNIVSAPQTVQGFDSRFDYDGSSNLIYSGYAPVGTLTSTATWALSKYTYSGSNLTLIQRATDSWDNRTTATYS